MTGNNETLYNISDHWNYKFLIVEFIEIQP